MQRWNGSEIFACFGCRDACRLIAVTSVDTRPESSPTAIQRLIALHFASRSRRARQFTPWRSMHRAAHLECDLPMMAVHALARRVEARRALFLFRPCAVENVWKARWFHVARYICAPRPSVREELRRLDSNVVHRTKYHNWRPRVCRRCRDRQCRHDATCNNSERVHILLLISYCVGVTLAYSRLYHRYVTYL